MGAAQVSAGCFITGSAFWKFWSSWTAIITDVHELGKKHEWLGKALKAAGEKISGWSVKFGMSFGGIYEWSVWVIDHWDNVLILLGLIWFLKKWFEGPGDDAYQTARLREEENGGAMIPLSRDVGSTPI
jgi:hypothetical protein